MIDDVEVFRTTIELESLEHRGYRVALHEVPVDTDAALSWIPASVLEEHGIVREKVWQFQQADGTRLARSTGYAIVHVAGAETNDEVVFAEPGDPVMLGARSLGGLNLTVDPVARRLVDAGPAPAAVSGELTSEL